MLAVTLQEQLNASRAAAPVRALRHDGVEWTYRATGTGSQGLMLLPAVVGAGQASTIERREEWTAAVTEFLRS